MIDIIIPVHTSRISELDQCINSLEEQSRLDLISKIIVVINPIKKKFQQDFSIPFVVHSTNSASAAEARNIGIANSTAEYMLFIDSDTKLDHRWIERGWKTLSLNPILTAVQGKIIPIQTSLAGEIRHALKRLRTNNSMIHFHNSERINPLLDTAAVLFRRSHVDPEVFDNAYRRQEDLEFSERIFSKGFAFAYLHDLIGHKSCDEGFCQLLGKLFLDGFYLRKYELSLNKDLDKTEELIDDLHKIAESPALYFVTLLCLLSHFLGHTWGKLALRDRSSVDFEQRYKPSKFLLSYLRHSEYSLNPFSRFILYNDRLIFNNFFKAKRMRDFNNLELDPTLSQAFLDLVRGETISPIHLQTLIDNNILLKK